MPNYVQLRVYRCAPVLPFRPGRLMLGGLFSAVLMSSEAASASMPTFDLGAFSSGLTSTADMSRFNTSNVLSPGIYRIDVIVNGQRVGRRDVDFIALDEKSGAVPCFAPYMLEQLGVALDRVDRSAAQDVMASRRLDGALCGDLGQWIPLASSSFDASTLEWSASVPQIYLKQSARGYVDPEYWDDGVTAGLLSYNFSTSTRTSGNVDDRTYLGLNTGVNLGSWRLRHQGALSQNSRSGLQPYQNTATYVQRSLAPWKSQLTIGDSFSSGQILDGVRVRGVTLASDERMLPQSQQGYAPQVRGVASSNATVTVSQNGYTIYETKVAPGPFVISDLFATGSGGDLTVSVTEVDGRRSTFVVPYSVTPQLLRADATKYSATLGEVRQRGIEGSAPSVFQGTLQRGLTDELTLYGGGSFSQGYNQGKLGIAVSTPLGAFSLDGSGSRTGVQGQGNLSGHSFGLGYSKNLPTSGTHFLLGAYRFSSDGYLSLPDAINVRELGRRREDTNNYARQKSRLDLTVSQKLGDGTLSLYGSSVDYWGSQQGRQTSFTVGYGSSWKRVTWNVSAQRSRVEDTRQLSDGELADEVFFGRTAQQGRVDNRFMLSLSMPLGSDFNSPSIYTSLSRDTGASHGAQQQVGLNGLYGENAEVSYGISGNRSTSEGSSSSDVNTYAGYRTRAANLRMGYGQSKDSSQLSFSADGAVVAHAGGMTLSQSLGEASTLVHAPNAEGAMLGGSGGTRIDSSGYAVVPSLRAFQNNVVEIDPEGTSLDVELKESTQTVAPTLGAVTLITFETVSGRAAVLKASQKNGQPLPFAAQVFNEQGLEVGVVGQASKAFVRGIADSGVLLVKWSEAADGQCHINYQMPPTIKGERQVDTDLLQGQCVAVTAPATRALSGL
ncbi:fimbrial biogenesis outer membrane usher protein [Pseudomonas yamanorum]|uniref:Fimbrial biogenesis outer membrane usher protein n=2 Tax=Pseudomonas yamanorum TaxID=515393 RepID=A0A7Y8FFZ8_9PSED|nr:fimbrial biogenesis outer membrane usher protein [Pseudomonas yamanorum]